MGGGVCAGGPVADVQSVVMLRSVIHFGCVWSYASVICMQILEPGLRKMASNM